MSGYKSILKKIFTWFMRLLPLFCMAAALIWLNSGGRELTLEAVMNYSPTRPLAAAAFLIFAFGAKSLSMMLPVLLLFAVGGKLFPLPIALLVNTLGIAVTLSLPYFVGRASGDDLTERLMVKYPKLHELREMRSRNNFFFSFLVRAMGVLPCDVVSLYLGNTRMPYPQYIAGGVLGFMPDLICATIVGMKISDTGSPWFWITIVINIIICVTSILFYRSYRRRFTGKTEGRANG